MTNTKQDLSWLPMTQPDIVQAAKLGDRVHVEYPEDLDVFSSRCTTYPSGCFVLRNPHIDVAGYCIFHPWNLKVPPELNSPLHAVPNPHDCIHLHDIVIDEPHRGFGLTSSMMSLIFDHALAHDIQNITLVSVAGTEEIWRHFGFLPFSSAEAITAVRSYSDSSIYMVKSLNSRISQKA
jgi:hypothetical protein